VNILVIGESCVDTFMYGSCNRLCPEAPAPVFNPLFSTANGGMARNVLENLMSFGVECDLCTNPNWEEVTKTRFIDHNFNHMFLRVDANDNITRVRNLRDINYAKYDAIIISDYNKGFLDPEDIDYIAGQHDLVLLDTKKILEESWCKNIKFIKINNHEYKKTKHMVVENMKDKLIITKGADGCTYKDKTYDVKKVEIKDSSGAGDTFLAAFTTKYVQDGDIDEAIDFANQCATAAVQKRGVATVKLTNWQVRDEEEE
jgi:bifunctional ADP-heptose synthase (sugar kinase/adenylyltransferase)